MYKIHPSSKLNSLFLHKPFQGANPEDALFLFIGLDANYHIEIESSAIFSKIIEYHNNGISFWENHNVHHPFLLPEYKGDGSFYHKSFSNIGFTSQNANLISFVELLNVPTVGRNKLELEDISFDHLTKINSWILNGKAEYIFLSESVARLMYNSGIFKWLPRKPQDKIGSLGVYYHKAQKTVYSHLHFSVYGKFNEQKNKQAAEIYNLLISK
jgi:hypothetical protein